jgi:hypothetical protein
MWEEQVEENNIISLRAFAKTELSNCFQELGVAMPDFLTELLAETDPSITTEPAFWDMVGISDYRIDRIAGGICLHARFGPLPGYEPRIEFPGLEEFEVLFADFCTASLNIAENASLILEGPTLVVRMPGSLLKGRQEDGDSDSVLPAEIEISGIGRLTADFNGRVELAPLGDEGLRLLAKNTPWDIADTGMKLEPGTLKLESDGDLKTFRLLLEKATLILPPDLGGDDPVRLSLENAMIGRNGFSGSVKAELKPSWDEAEGRFVGAGSADLAGIPIGIRLASVRFEENLPVGFELRAEAALPFFDKGRPVLTIGFDANQALKLGMEAAEGGALELEKEGVARLLVDALGITIKEDRAELTFTGDLKPALPSGDLSIPDFTIRVEGLKVSTDGKVTLDAGWIVFQPELAADLIGFSVSLYKVGIGFGDEFWIGLDGKVKLVDGLPGATLIGLKLSFDPATFGSSAPVTPTLSLDGIYLEADIAETVIIKGGGRIIKEESKRGFSGDMLLALPQLGFGLDASLLAGINTATPPYPFLYLALGVELPTPIPLGQSGLGLFGVQGLLGLNTYPNFEGGEDKSWYYDWYKAPPVSGVTHSSKWTDKYLGFALGAGVTLCTTDGFTVLTRSLLVLALPGPLILIEGRAAFLTSRTALSDNPPLRALMVLDLRSDSRSIQLFIEAQYEFVEGILFAHGILDVFSELKRNPNWHIYLGRREPKSKRIQAEVLKKFLRGDAYFQIHPPGIDFGGSVGYKIPTKKIGPVKVGLDACAVFDGQLSFDPSQLTASLELWGRLIARAFGIGFDFSVNAAIAAKAPTPWWLRLYFALKLNLPWPLPDPEIEIEQLYEEDLPPAFPPVLTQVQALSATSQKTWDFRNGSHIEGIPVDAKLCLSLAHRAINESNAGIGGLEAGLNYAHKVGEYIFEYKISNISLVRENDGQALPVYGVWQVNPKMRRDATDGTIVLFSKSSFVYSRWLLGTGVVREVAQTTDVRPGNDGCVAQTSCITFGEHIEQPEVLPHCFERDGVSFLVWQPAVAVEIPIGSETSFPLFEGLNVISAFGIDFDYSDKKGQFKESPKGKLQTIFLEIRWSYPVIIKTLEAKAERILAGYRDSITDFVPEKTFAVDRLYLVGHTINLKKICYVSYEDAQMEMIANINSQAGDKLIRQLAGLFYWEDEEFVFEPNTTYRLTVQVDKASTPDNSGASSGSASEQHSVTFTTRGTPDNLEPYIRPPWPLLQEHSLPEGETARLQVSAPEGFHTAYADGTLIPVYRSAPVYFFFNVNYIRKMYELVAEEELEVVFLDPAGNEIEGRVTEWMKARDRVDLENTALFLEAVNRSLSNPIDVSALPKDDVLVSQPASAAGSEEENPIGWLLPGVVHRVQIRRKSGTQAQGQILYETRIRSSKFASWEAMFDTINRQIPVIDVSMFGNADFSTLTSLDDAAALPLVSTPLPANVVAYIVRDSDRNLDVVVLELPEPLPRQGFQIYWLDADGNTLNTGSVLSRSDHTRWAWVTRSASAIAALKVIWSRPGALQGEPDVVQKSLIISVEVTGEQS